MIWQDSKQGNQSWPFPQCSAKQVCNSSIITCTNAPIPPLFRKAICQFGARWKWLEMLLGKFQQNPRLIKHIAHFLYFLPLTAQTKARTFEQPSTASNPFKNLWGDWCCIWSHCLFAWSQCAGKGLAKWLACIIVIVKCFHHQLIIFWFDVIQLTYPTCSAIVLSVAGYLNLWQNKVEGKAAKEFLESWSVEEALLPGLCISKQSLVNWTSCSFFPFTCSKGLNHTK